MDCGRVLDQLSVYIDGMLDERSLEEVEKHLAECEDCRAELESLRMLVGAARELEASEPPVDLRRRIAAATTNGQEAAIKTGFLVTLREMLSPRTAALAGAVACAMVALTIVSGHHNVADRVDRVAVRVPSPAPVPAAVHATPTGPAVSAAAAPESLEAARPASSVQPHRAHRVARKGVSDARRVAVLPKPVQKMKSTAQPKANSNAAIGAPVDVAEMDDTTSATTVDYKPAEKPAPKVADTPAKERPTLIRVAVSTVPKQEETEQWLKDMKTRASMRGRDRGSNVVSVISARF